MLIKNLPEFASEKEYHKFLVDKEEQIFAQAKSSIKHSDGFNNLSIPLKSGITNKSQDGTEVALIDKPVLEVKAVISTTNIIDSHKDVHIPGLWKKSLDESNRMLHVQEHKSNEFDKIISSGKDLKAYTEMVTWKSLGYNAVGKTEAFTFDSSVRKDRNVYMHEQYAKGRVDNHSVGMIYVKLVTCINDEDYPVQKENFDKYFPMIVNQNEVGKVFWAVLEAKAIEGSAVPNGSNFVTPTTSTKSKKDEVLVENKELQAIKSFLGIQ